MSTVNGSVHRMEIREETSIRYSEEPSHIHNLTSTETDSNLDDGMHAKLIVGSLHINNRIL